MQCVEGLLSTGPTASIFNLLKLLFLNINHLRYCTGRTDANLNFTEDRKHMLTGENILDCLVCGSTHIKVYSKYKNVLNCNCTVHYALCSVSCKVQFSCVIVWVTPKPRAIILNSRLMRSNILGSAAQCSAEKSNASKSQYRSH